ncbi:MAG TPA: LuxR C-terminal-related transcriptional regulator [Nocardioidaceae bacterium]|nr:LuxR C-terminal-related transcriptional regulator [Nocardioidaceae bacterium]
MRRSSLSAAVRRKSTGRLDRARARGPPTPRAGASNAKIGERLVVSLPTVRTHVGGVQIKLGLPDRVHAVVFAYEAGVVRAGTA